MELILKRLTEPSTYAGVAGLLMFGSGDLTLWINLAGAAASLLAVVLKEKAN